MAQKMRAHVIVVPEAMIFSLGKTWEDIEFYLPKIGQAYAWIKHDKDNGVNPHYHILVKHPNPRQGHTVVRELNELTGLSLNREGFQNVNNFRATCSYLTHRTRKAEREGKFVYDVDEVHGTMDYVDWSKWVEGGDVDFFAIFSKDTLLESKKAFEEECGSLSSLNQFSTFVRTFQTFKQIVKEEKEAEILKSLKESNYNG